MRLRKIAAGLTATLIAVGGISVAVAPIAAAANTIIINSDCQTAVDLYANVGDTIIITMNAGCTDPAGYIWNLNGTRLVDDTGSGFLSQPSSIVNPGENNSQSGYVDDWYVYYAGSGTTVVTTTLLGTDGAGNPLVPGSVVASFGRNGAAKSLITWRGGVSESHRDLTLWHQSTGRAAGASCPDGWSASWEEWAVAGTGGAVCQRDLYAYGTDAVS
jgi:hypothetical protein